jgi:hypothetical protein
MAKKRARIRLVVEERQRIGSVGVDAGMIYCGDPCFIKYTPLGRSGLSDETSEPAWDEFLQGIATPGKDYMEDHATVKGRMVRLDGTVAHEFPAGVCVHSGYGDGEYPVYVTRNKEGRVASLTIEFIPEEE